MGKEMPFWTKTFVNGVPMLFSYRILYTVLITFSVFLFFKELFKRTPLILWVPFLGKSALLKARLSFLKILSIGIESNQPPQLCFLSAKRSIEHAVFKKRAEKAENLMMAGADFTTVLCKTNLLTPLQKSLIMNSGGNSENLRKSFDAILEFLEKEVESHNIIVVQFWKLLVMLCIVSVSGVTLLAYLYPLLGWVAY